MKIKLVILQLLGLVFANGCGALLPVFADNAAPPVAAKEISAAHDTNFTGRVVAAGSTSHIRMLASALDNARMNLEVIANNLANLHTTGYKAMRLEFQDLSSDANGRTTLLKGAAPTAARRDFSQGELIYRPGDLNFAIQGEGFFQVQMPDGVLAFTRDGTFKKDATGRIVTAEGYPVLGGFQPVNPGASLTISTSGQASCSQSDNVAVFQVQLAFFNNPEGLDAIGYNLFKATVVSGDPQFGNPGQGGFGLLKQGFLELSNVSATLETANYFMAQEAYDATSRALKTAEKQIESNLQVSK